MSKLLIKQRVFSWTDTYDVYDYRGEPKYFVKADFFTLGHRLHIYSHATGSEVGLIHERVISMMGKADITIGGVPIGTISRRFTLFRPKYTVEYKGWDVQGDFFAWDYSIVDSSGRSVATISKELFRWGDTYALDILSDENELSVLVLALTIDMLSCER